MELARIDKLEALLALASPQALETAAKREETPSLNEYLDCPFCDGEGSVDGVTLTNYDGEAVGIQFFGVGDQFVHNETAFRALWRDAPWLIECAREMHEACAAALATHGCEKSEPGLPSLKQVEGMLRAALSKVSQQTDTPQAPVAPDSEATGNG